MRCHSYLFFDIEQSVHTLSAQELVAAKGLFEECVARHTGVRTLAYATLAFKAGTRFMLYCRAEEPDAIQLLLRDLLRTTLGRHLRVSYTLMGYVKPSQYNPAHAPKESSPESPHRYLVVYPFTKTTEWHLMPYDLRRAIMKAHVDVGRKYSERIGQLLLYAYGIDDHEFIVSYQMDSLEEFQSLVMDMRATESRRYTKNDLPIFTGIHMSLTEALEMI